MLPFPMNLRLTSNRNNFQVTLEQIKLTSPVNFGEIYQAAIKVISELYESHGDKIELTYHLSPGTPAMAAVWILIAKTLYLARLIESSKGHGVNTVSIPFDISADFIPEIINRQDKQIEKMAFGLSSDDAPEFGQIIHRSEAMARVIFKAKQVAPRSLPVLIEGESGTGKELFARAIHDASPRRDNPFITVNCGAIPKDLLESEMFGHERGAFTGADRQRIGHFEAAHKGTIFLDEIGELPKEMQVKLLRTLQEKEVKRIGSTKTQKVDIRIIAATNRTLINEVAMGSFREDLFYRLAVGVLKLPPLRERSGDVSLLTDHFLEKINNEHFAESNYKFFSASAKNLLLQHPWPGNVRELQNTLIRAAIWSLDNVISLEDVRDALFPVKIQPEGSSDQILNRSIAEGIDLPEIMAEVATHYLKKALSFTNHNKTQAAEILGLPSYQTLNNWVKKYSFE